MIFIVKNSKRMSLSIPSASITPAMDARSLKQPHTHLFFEIITKSLLVTFK